MATLIFIPWHWNTPACYDAFIDALSAYGFTGATVILPYPGCDAATYDFVDEITLLKETLTGLSRIRRDVILVLHPQGKRRSLSAKDLGNTQRAERKLQSGVVRMIFFMAFMSPIGFNPTNGDEEVAPDSAEFQMERGIVSVNDDESMKVFLQYLPASEAQHWAARMLPQSVGVFWSTSNYTGWQNIPSKYLLHSDNRLFRVPYAHYKLEHTRRVSGVF
ncbi:hypothetical protein BDV96DRAFT_151332 [Lophiotrema nucula]|uniref:AB hydrolase-1 domain-containing protein n=1 Tax=Lophiotrema nucula TaxID=690887 RepID=A0A6A5Z110_9PLEO|nr:hypothetical protein BDV96DRAFT_151332 [Lophiotrema nucula]